MTEAERKLLIAVAEGLMWLGPQEETERKKEELRNLIIIVKAAS